MSRIVIMQPYYLAWYGFFEQIKLADIYVFYDDVQYVKRSLMSRVDIKTPQGPKWLTVPVRKAHQDCLIKDIVCFEDDKWRENHLMQLRQNYSKAPFFKDMFDLASSILNDSGEKLIDVSISAIRKIAEYYQLDKKVTFLKSSQLGIPGESTQRLYDISKSLGATKYLTGLGALRYMNFEVFDHGGVEVEFIKYAKTPYPQMNGEFNPFVSILDLVANTGIDGINYMNSIAENYAEFIKTDDAQEYLSNFGKNDR